MKTFLKRPCIWQILHVIHFICDKSIQTPRERHYRSRKSPTSRLRFQLSPIGLCDTTWSPTSLFSYLSYPGNHPKFIRLSSLVQSNGGHQYCPLDGPLRLTICITTSSIVTISTLLSLLITFITIHKILSIILYWVNNIIYSIITQDIPPSETLWSLTTKPFAQRATPQVQLSCYHLWTNNGPPQTQIKSNYLPCHRSHKHLHSRTAHHSTANAVTPNTKTAHTNLSLNISWTNSFTSSLQIPPGSHLTSLQAAPRLPQAPALPSRLVNVGLTWVSH